MQINSTHALWHIRIYYIIKCWWSISVSSCPWALHLQNVCVEFVCSNVSNHCYGKWKEELRNCGMKYEMSWHVQDKEHPWGRRWDVDGRPRQNFDVAAASSCEKIWRSDLTEWHHHMCGVDTHRHMLTLTMTLELTELPKARKVIRRGCWWLFNPTWFPSKESSCSDSLVRWQHYSSLRRHCTVWWLAVAVYGFFGFLDSSFADE